MATTSSMAVLESDEVVVFSENKSRLSTGLQSSIRDLAQHCYAKDLIPRAVYRGMFDNRQTPEYLRAQYFMDLCLVKICDFEEVGKFGASKKFISQLAAVVRNDPALSHIADRIDSFVTSKDMRESLSDITPAISSNLYSIAGLALSQNLITFEEHETVLIPGADNDRFFTEQVLNELLRRIRNDKSVFYKFIEVLKKMGEPITTYGRELENALERPMDIN